MKNEEFRSVVLNGVRIDPLGVARWPRGRWSDTLELGSLGVSGGRRLWVHSFLPLVQTALFVRAKGVGGGEKVENH